MAVTNPLDRAAARGSERTCSCSSRGPQRSGRARLPHGGTGAAIGLEGAASAERATSPSSSLWVGPSRHAARVTPLQVGLCCKRGLFLHLDGEYISSGLPFFIIIASVFITKLFFLQGQKVGAKPGEWCFGR